LSESDIEIPESELASPVLFMKHSTTNGSVIRRCPHPDVVLLSAWT